MKCLNRALISIYRKPYKSLLLFILVFILSILISGAVLIKQAIINTDQSFRNMMPAMVTLDLNFDVEAAEAMYAKTGHWPEYKLPTPELIREVSKFPQVRAFDYSIGMSWGVHAPNLKSWNNPNFSSSLSMDDDEDLGVRLQIIGINSPDFLELQNDFIQIISGRVFSEAEMNSGSNPYPAMIASGFATTNGLIVGSVFDAKVTIWDYEIVNGEQIENRDSEPILEEIFPLEVIGIFEPIVAEAIEDAPIEELFQADRKEAKIQHRVYLPNRVVEQMFEARSVGELEPDEISFHNFFILNDPMDIRDFALEVEHFDETWKVMDLSSGFSEISLAMDNMRGIADTILWLSIVSTLCIICLLILLFLRDRKNEIGIYLALGERKKVIVFQLIIEVVSVAIGGMTVALFVGYQLAGGLGREMLKRDMAHDSNDFVLETIFNPLEELGYRLDLTPEEMLDTYEVSLSTKDVLLFYSIGLSTILIATSIPVVCMTRINPKKILL